MLSFSVLTYLVECCCEINDKVLNSRKMLSKEMGCIILIVFFNVHFFEPDKVTF